MNPSCRHHAGLVGGFTLLELMCALVILGIILLAMQSAMMVAGKAVPSGSGLNASTYRASYAMDLISSDLQYATSITTMTATDVQFVVADRNNDGASETIRYTWSGTPGAPLTRTYNSGSAVTILNNVQEFSLAYDKNTTALPTTYSESAETLICSYDPVLLLVDWAVTTNGWIAQYFKPTLPAGTISWRITRVRIKASASAVANGTNLVQLRYTNSGLPLAATLDQVTMLESSLPASDAWQDCNFSNNSGIPPGAALAVVVQCAANSPSCNVQYQLAGALADSAYMVTTSNAGGSWSSVITQAMPYYVYGKITTADAIAYQYTLSDVRASVRAGSDSRSRVTTTIRVLNQPTVTGP